MHCPPRHRSRQDLLPRGWRGRAGSAGVALLMPLAAQAQDASRGAQLYLQLPGVASCVSCHGPDPSQGRNNLLRAADQPQALQKALSTVGVMGYLKPLLADADVADLSAYLGAVQRAAAADSPVALWPVTVEFGGLALGSVSPVQTVVLRNLQTAALPISAPQVIGPAATSLLVDTDCPAALPPASECRVRLRAQALAAGPSAGALRFASGSVPPWIVGMSFTARGDAVGVLSADLAQPSLDFGRPAPSEPVLRSFRLLNHGSAAATLGVISITGPGRTAFRIEAATNGPEPNCAAGLTLAPGAACAMRLGFAAGIAGDFRAALQWRGDATQPANVELRGVVVASPASPPAPAPTAPNGNPPSESPGGGGCASAPAVRRVDPALPLMVMAALAWLGLRRRSAGVTTLSRDRHGSFTTPA